MSTALAQRIRDRQRQRVARVWVLAFLLGIAPLASAEPPSPERPSTSRSLGGIGSAVMGLAGLIMVIRRFRQRNKLISEDKKFGDYRGPKT